MLGTEPNGIYSFWNSEYCSLDYARTWPHTGCFLLMLFHVEQGSPNAGPDPKPLMIRPHQTNVSPLKLVERLLVNLAGFASDSVFITGSMYLSTHFNNCSWSDMLYITYALLSVYETPLPTLIYWLFFFKNAIRNVNVYSKSYFRNMTTIWTFLTNSSYKPEIFGRLE